MWVRVWISSPVTEFAGAPVGHAVAASAVAGHPAADDPAGHGAGRPRVGGPAAELLGHARSGALHPVALAALLFPAWLNYWNLLGLRL